MIFSDFQELETSRLRLRRLRLEDVPAYFTRLGSSHNVTKCMLWQPHKDISESAASIRKVLHRYEEGSCCRWGIALKSDDSLIGIIELLHFDEKANTCGFAYMLGEDFWGCGYGTEALKAALAFAFGTLHVSAVIADHFEENPASGAVMRKAGMRFIRMIPERYEKNGRKHNALEYRITRADWDSRTRH